MTIYDYADVFKQYFERASEKRIFAERFVERFGDLSGRTRILDLGCHDGALILRCLASLGDDVRKNIELVAVDPSATALETFRQRDLPEGVTAEFVADTAENYVDSYAQQLDASPYDWAVVSHSLYWSPALETVLGQLMRISNRAVVVMRQEQSPLYKMQHRFRSWIGNAQEQLYSANDVEIALNALGVQFEREDVVSEIDLPPKGDPARAIVIGFFLQTTATALIGEKMDEIERFLEQEGMPLPHAVSLFWIDS